MSARSWRRGPQVCSQTKGTATFVPERLPLTSTLIIARTENGSWNCSLLGGPDNSWDEQGCQQQEWCPVRGQGRRKVATNCHRGVRR